MTYASLLKEREENLREIVASVSQRLSVDLPMGNLSARITEAYCAIRGIDQPILSKSRDLVKFREEVYEWYIQIYTARAQQKGKQGAHRGVSQGGDESDYCFDHLYDKAQFKRFVFDGVRPSAEFIMHMAVAFKMPVVVLNALLKQYGYLPLHVKNVHHLAIGSVLSVCDPKDDNYSQFHLIKQRYFDTLRQISTAQIKLPEQSLATTIIREELSNLGKLNDARYAEFVGRFAAELNWRHSAILAEHSRLTRIFADLYEGRRKGMYWEPETVPYSLASFVERFCKPISLKRFNDNLMTYIRDNGKHPTRESMILLWLYAECHHGHVIEKCPSKYIRSNGLDDYCGEMRSAETTEGVAYQCRSFDIHRYLFPKDEAQLIWDGSAVLHRINSYLLRYDWGVLNEQHPFDRLIKQLLELKIEKSRRFGDTMITVRFSGHIVCRIDTAMVDDSVPLPLCWMCGFLSMLQRRMSGTMVEPKLTNQLKKMLREVYGICRDDRNTVAWSEFMENSQKLQSKNGFLCSDVLTLYELTSRLIATLNPQSQKEIRSSISKLQGKLVDALPYPLQCDLYEQL